MYDFDISSVVVAKDNKPVGIVTKRDFLEPLVQKDIIDRRLTVQFSIKDFEITGLQRNLIMDDFEAFAQRYSDALGAGILFVYMKTHGTNYKGDPLTHCRLHLRTNKGPTFFSSSEGFGIEQIFRLALERLERQVLRSKTLEYDPEFARTYLRRLHFPLSER